MLICMVGPNAIGKTTAMKRLAKRYGHLVKLCSADQCLIFSRDSEPEREPGWNKTKEDKQRLVHKHEQADHLMIVESARTDLLRFISDSTPGVIVYTTPDTMRTFIQNRCAAKNKKFREDYWTPNKLKYECSGRYLNAGAREVADKLRHEFLIENQETDWPKVDACLSKLIRIALRNQRCYS